MDSSSSRCGVALMEDERLLETRSWRKNERSSWAQNLYEWFVWCHRLIGEVTPSLVVLERNGWTPNRDAAYALASFESATILAAKCRDVPVVQARASEARKVALGHGGLSKDAAVRLVRTRFPDHEFGCPDEADATALALAASGLVER